MKVRAGLDNQTGIGILVVWMGVESQRIPAARLTRDPHCIAHLTPLFVTI